MGGYTQDAIFLHEFIDLIDERHRPLAIPLRKDEPPWDVLKYHPEEITELYLGLAIMEENRKDMVSKATALNPEISIFQAGRDANAKLTFNRI